ncbi:MAG: transposase [Pirellulaceae bacterium]
MTAGNGSRNLDLSTAKRLGKDDYEVTIQRPSAPDWMDQETYEAMPPTLKLRVIIHQVNTPGFRPKEIIVVTTLLDSVKYPAADVAALYHERWTVELNIRALKSSMGMNDLRCKSPEMVEKEIWTCLLAYNLVRLKLLQAAVAHGKTPIRLSFTHGLQVVTGTWTTAPMMVTYGERNSEKMNHER